VSNPRICPGCRRRVIGKCVTCQPFSAGKPAKPRASRQGYGRREADRRHDTVRAWVERNGWVCPGWQRERHPATDLTADHIDPLGLGGPQGGELAVLCKSCNSAKQDSLPPPEVPGLTVTLVAGPPCGGKNTYVLSQAGPADLVVDFDALAVALQPKGSTHGHVEAHKQFVFEARDAVLERLRLGGHGVRAAWVIASAPKKVDRERYRRRYGARVVVVSSPEEVCLRRAMGERPGDWYGYVRDWFAAYEPDPRDVVVRGFDPGV
jgi:predicted kinase